MRQPGCRGAHYGRFWEILFRNSREHIFVSNWHFPLLVTLQAFQISEQPKKDNKGHEGHSKGQKAKSWKADNFFMFLGPFGVNLLVFLVFSSFEALKAKKAARVARTTIFCSGMSNDPKLLS